MRRQRRDVYGLLLVGHVHELSRQTCGESVVQPPPAALMVL
ncbi:hypothetical protein [Streptomyces sp. NPDC014622]